MICKKRKNKIIVIFTILIIMFIPTISTNADANVSSSQSGTNVIIEPGYLTLNEVPDFNFGTASSGGKQTLPLLNNNVGQNNSKLIISDSKDSQRQIGNWTLSASLGAFGTSNGNPWKLNLNSTDITSGNTFFNQPKVQLISEDDGQSHDVVILQAKPWNGEIPNKPIETIVNYGRSGLDTASLTIPDNVTPQNYSATITWKLARNTKTNPAGG